MVPVLCALALGGAGVWQYRTLFSGGRHDVVRYAKQGARTARRVRRLGYPLAVCHGGSAMYMVELVDAPCGRDGEQPTELHEDESRCDEQCRWKDLDLCQQVTLPRRQLTDW